MDSRWDAALAALWKALPPHIALSAAALALGVAVALPFAVIAARRPGLRWAVLTAASVVQTVPALALLALFYPLLLALAALTGTPIPALGFLPSLLALALYSMLPMLRNGVTALTGIDPAVSEAADGLGMTAGQKLRLVEAPLAAPVVMAGIRTAAVWTIGTATLSTTVGQPGLGDLIFAGLQTEDWVLVLAGCAGAAGLALVADQLLGLIEGGLAKRSRWRVATGLALLIAGLAAALVPVGGTHRETVVVGAKNFSEQYILAALISDRLRAAGFDVQTKSGLGSAVAFRALEASDVDVYVDYGGTLWANELKRTDTPPAPAMNAEIARWLAARGGRVVGSLGFENAYALAMTRKRATELGVTSIADLTRVASQLTFGSDLEFLSRPEWTAIRTAYGLRFRAARSFSPTFVYRAVTDGTVDVISAFSSDGRIAADDLVVLADPKGAIPAYDALLLVSPRHAKDSKLLNALAPLNDSIPVERMREANLMVDRDSNKQSPEAAARWLASRSARRPAPR